MPSKTALMSATKYLRLLKVYRIPFSNRNLNDSLYSTNYYKRTWCDFVIFVVACSSVSFLSMSRCDKDEDKLSKQQFADELKRNLFVTRQRLKRSGCKTPYFFYHIDKAPDGTDIYLVELRIIPNMNISGALSKWSSITTNTDSSSTLTHQNKELENNEKYGPYSQHNGFTLSSHDNKTVITLKPDTLSLAKEEGFTAEEIRHIVEGYEVAYASTNKPSISISTSSDLIDDHPFSKILSALQQGVDGISNGSEQPSETIEVPLNDRNGSDLSKIMKSLGLIVYDKDSANALDWDTLAGYDSIKNEIEDTIINALQYPNIYDKVASGTRVKYTKDCNRPKAVLFEGPPGTGKTLSARVIASKCGRPMIHLPVESLVSKWYGDSEKKMAQIFDACDKAGGAIIFIDEIDGLVTSRDSATGMHEASRRIMSVLLQRLDGFTDNGKSLVICATNRMSDLDKALLSRFDLTIRYDLPDFQTRTAVFGRYAKQLSSSELSDLAAMTDGMSCRDIRDICQQAERSIASQIIKKKLDNSILPKVIDYQTSIGKRRASGVGIRSTSTSI